MIDFVGLAKKLQTFKERYNRFPNALVVSRKDYDLIQMSGKASTPGVTEVKTVEGMRIIVGNVDSPTVGILLEELNA